MGPSIAVVLRRYYHDTSHTDELPELYYLCDREHLPDELHEPECFDRYTPLRAVMPSDACPASGDSGLD